MPRGREVVYLLALRPTPTPKPKRDAPRPVRRSTTEARVGGVAKPFMWQTIQCVISSV